MGIKRQLLRVGCIKRIGFWLLLNYTAISIVNRKPKIGRGSKFYSQRKWTGSVSSSQTRRMGFTLGKLSTQVRLYSEWWNTGLATNKHYQWLFQIKKQSDFFLSLIRRNRLQSSLDILYLNLWKRSAMSYFISIYNREKRKWIAGN